jgi:hypothetical protein
MTANEIARPPLPEGRYGRPPRRWLRLVAIFVAGLLGTAAAVWFGWVALYHADPPVRATVVRYEVTSPTSVEVTFELIKDPAVAAVCVVRARNEPGEEVGRRAIRVAAGGPRQRLLTESLATRDTAVVGEVRECQAVTSNP